MKVRRLGRSDLQVSSIGIGGATFGREIDEAVSFQVLDRALERGITLFDTAEAYSQGRSEEIVGHWIADRGVRDRMVLATKVSGTLTRERVVTSAEASLRRLGVETIDLFQLHSWDGKTPLEETLAGLDELVRSGKVRYIGCSNFAAWQLCKSLWRQDVAGWARFESVQPVYNLAKREIEQELLPLCADQQVGVITYSPLGAGFLTGKYYRGGPVPDGTRFDVSPGHQDVYFHEQCYVAMEHLRATAARLEMPMAKLGLAWVLSRTGTTTVLVGARNIEQVDQAFEADQLANVAELQAEFAAL